MNNVTCITFLNYDGDPCIKLRFYFNCARASYHESEDLDFKDTVKRDTIYQMIPKAYAKGLKVFYIDSE